jgi:hypothetical protein
VQRGISWFPVLDYEELFGFGHLKSIPTVKTARVLGRSGALDALVLTPISVA